MSSPATKFCEAQGKGLSPSVLYFLSDKSLACECQGPSRTKASRFLHCQIFEFEGRYRYKFLDIEVEFTPQMATGGSNCPTREGGCATIYCALNHCERDRIKDENISDFLLCDKTTLSKTNDRKVNDRNPSLARSIFPAPRATVERGGPRKQAASFPHRFASSPSTGFRFLLSFLPSTEDVASKQFRRADPTGPSTPYKKADQPPTREGLRSTNYL
ncbi:hypothetical protein TNCT_627641 [Trichonephila clavata]|uniref:Uncharacterized protein n=1 Tax=Trichonephila clavata TaxID=2740835 RepID=A0A8X6GMG7_TRICU|nr:hypothetical protein TNCT_627641 [Trichonephila clavata]